MQTLDLSKTAVLSLHMLNDVVSKEGKFGQFFGEQAEKRDVINNSKTLLEAARSVDLPVFHIAVRYQPGHPDLIPNCQLLTMVKEMDAFVEGTWGGDFVEELQPLENEMIISHQRVGAFQETDLASLLKEKGIETVFVYGVTTNVIVEHTVRNACDLGLNVVVEDCCSAGTLEAHNASIETINMLANVVSLNKALSLLERK